SKSTHFEHYVPHSKAIQYQLSADILILAINKSVNNKQIVTGKVYEYLAAKRPILCIGPLDGEIALILKDVPNAAIFDYEDIDGVKDFISDVFNKKTSNDLSSNTNEQFSRIALTKQLSELMHSLRN
ncbi:MAG TPA: hypothetical protein PKD85_07185, partial [Saprospiraceae bacterium]|nr:hypothetical protein [Saprospiraceae bacterium]